MDIANESDLQSVIPDVFSYGISDFTSALGEAANDVINLIKSSWWPNATRNSFIFETQDVAGALTIAPLDPIYLDSAALRKLVVYRAASAYIYPKLATFQDNDGDAFTRKSEFYRTMYNDEWEVVKQLPLYDFNKDGQFADIERRVNNGRRIWRA